MSTAPATLLPRGRRARLAAPVLTAAAVVVASAVLHVRDPHRPGSYLFCPWLLLTGTYCPGCGGLRAVHDLTHGDLASAASSNLLLVAAVPVVALLWGRWTVRRWRGAAPRGEPGTALLGALVLAAAAGAFWVLRNLPALGWLAP